MSINNSFNEPLENLKLWQNINPVKDYRIDTPGDIVAIFLRVHNKDMITNSENLPSLQQVFKLIVDNKEILKKPNLKSLDALFSIMSNICFLVRDRKTFNLIDDTFLDSLNEIILPHFLLNTNSPLDSGKKNGIQACLSMMVKLMPKDNVSETALAKINRLRSVIITD